MTLENKLKRLDELRMKWKECKDPMMKKVIEKQAMLIKITLPKIMC